MCGRVSVGERQSECGRGRVSVGDREGGRESVGERE